MVFSILVRTHSRFKVTVKVIKVIVLLNRVANHLYSFGCILSRTFINNSLKNKHNKANISL